MKFTIAFVICSVLIVSVWSESCVQVLDCMDTFCKHDTTPSCELGLCTCGPPPYSYHCKLKGDCDRHVEECSAQWHCINNQCRCGP